MQNHEILKRFEPYVQTQHSHHVNAHQFDMRPDGKIDCTLKVSIDTPWIFIKVRSEKDCAVSHGIINPLFGIIPDKCLNCYKVCVRPKNVKKLFDLYEMMKEWGFFSKCGVEKRDHVFGNYGAYFYTDSVDEGLHRWRYIRKKLDKDDYGVFLKRGCTEFEHGIGDSRLWKKAPGQDELEAQLRELLVVKGQTDNPTPDVLAEFVKKRWLVFAHGREDASYLEVTGGVDLYPKYVTYHPEEE